MAKYAGEFKGDEAGRGIVEVRSSPVARLRGSTDPHPMRRRVLQWGLSSGGAAMLAACGAGGGGDVGQSDARSASTTVTPRPEAQVGSGAGALPPALGDKPIAQFLTHDGPSGAHQKYWNLAAELQWRNPGVGDWRDAAGMSQGAEAFASAEISSVGPVSWDLTTLVSQQIAGENRGFFLKAEGTFFKYEFFGRSAPDAAVRPRLLVETDQGVFECPARANAQWFISSVKTIDSSAVFTIQMDQSHGIVQFDYSQVSGAVTRAIMTLHVGGAPRSGVVKVFEADPPRYVTGRGTTSRLNGLASQFPGDRGLQGHPSVLFASDFTDGAGSPSMRGWGPRLEKYPLVLRVDPETGLPYHHATLLAGQHEIESGTLVKPLVRADVGYGPPTSVVEEIYFRYRVRPNENWRSVVDSTKFPGVDMGFGYWTPTGYWQQVSGNGGVPGDGRYGPSWHKYPDGSPIWAYKGHMTRGHGGKYYPDGNPYSELFLRHSTYAYHLDPQDPNYLFGENFRWGESLLQRGRWHDIEHHVKVNSLIGDPDQYGNREAVYDGLYEGWIDGHLVFRKTNFRWRRNPLMGIEGIWLGFYHGGREPSPFTMNIDFGSIVVATEYIGPVAV